MFFLENMISRLEILPNEIFLDIFSRLLWNELLTSFWSLNKRFNSLICLTFSKNEHGIIINQLGLSYRTFLSKLFPLVGNCASLMNSIRYIYLDGTNSNSYDFFNSDQNILGYPNLDALILSRFYLSESLIENLLFLIEHRLKKLTLMLEKDIFTVFHVVEKPWRNGSSEGNSISFWQISVK